MAIVKGLNPIIILNRREKISKDLILKYSFTLEDLSNFFYVNPSVMNKFLKERGIIAPSIQIVENKKIVNDLKTRRDIKLKNAPKEELSSLLNKHGLWRLPKIKNIQLDSLKDLPNVENAKESLNLLQVGFTISDIKSYCNLTNVQLELIKEKVNQLQIPHGVNTRSSKETFETTKNMISNKYNYKLASKATGLSNPELMRHQYLTQEGGKDMSYERYIEVIEERKENTLKKIADKNNTILENKYNSPVKEQMKEEIFQRWMAAEKTQQELGDEYGYDRVTIGNWCREMKVKHKNEISQPTVRRRNFSEKTLRERSLENYDNPGMIRLSKEPNVTNIMNESPFKKYSEEKREKVSDISVDIYAKKTSVLFGYGPNKGKSMIDGKIQPGYFTRLQETTDLGKEFTYVDGAREHADKNKGEMKTFWDGKYGDSPDVER